MADDKNVPAELSETEMEQAVGGVAPRTLLKFDGVDGESTDDKHKGEIR